MLIHIVANLFIRPLTGMLGMVVLPTRGARASLQKALGRDSSPHDVLRGPREAQTRQAMSELTSDSNQRYLHTFSLLEKETSKRKRRMKRRQFLLFATKKERAAQKVDRQRAKFDRKERKEVDRKLKEREDAAKEEKKMAKKAAEEQKTREKEDKKARKQAEKEERKSMSLR